MDVSWRGFLYWCCHLIWQSNWALVRAVNRSFILGKVGAYARDEAKKTLKPASTCCFCRKYFTIQTAFTVRWRWFMWPTCLINHPIHSKGQLKQAKNWFLCYDNDRKQIQLYWRTWCFGSADNDDIPQARRRSYVKSPTRSTEQDSLI